MQCLRTTFVGKIDIVFMRINVKEENQFKVKYPGVFLSLSQCIECMSMGNKLNDWMNNVRLIECDVGCTEYSLSCQCTYSFIRSECRIQGPSGASHFGIFKSVGSINLVHEVQIKKLINQLPLLTCV